MLKLLSKCLLFIILAVFLALYCLLATEFGARFALNAVRAQLPGFQLHTVNGRLLGPLQLQGLEYRSETLNLSFASIALDWKPGSLFRGELLLSKLVVSDVLATGRSEAETPKSTEPFVLPQELPLPLTVRVRELLIDGIEWRSNAQASPLLIHSVEAAIVANSSAVNIQALDVEASLFSLSGNSKTNVQRNYETDANLNWQLRLDKVAEVDGTLHLTGDQSELHSELNVIAKTEHYGRFNAAMNSVANTESASIDKFELSLNGTDVQVSGQGRVNFSSAVIGAELTWKNLQWPLPPAMEAQNQAPNSATDALIASAKGAINLSGTLQDYSAELDAALSTKQTPNGNVSAQANGSTQHLNISALTLNALSGTVNGTAALDWRAALKTTFDIHGKNLNPGGLAPQWPGVLRFTAKGHHQAATENTAQKLTVRQLAVNGVLREVPVSAAAQLSADGRTIKVKSLSAKAEGSALQASGMLGQRSDFKWRLNSSNLAALHPQATGAVSSHGDVTGSVRSPAISMKLNASDFGFQQYTLGKVDLDAEIDLASAKKSSLQVSVVDGQLPGLLLNNLSVQASGTRKAHGLTLSTQTPYGGAQLRLNGGLHDGHWSGQLENSEFSPKDFPPWRLSEAVNIAASAKQQSIERACWASEQSTVCLQGKAKSPAVNAKLDITDFNLALFQKFLAPELSVRGMLSGEVSFMQKIAAQWQLESKLENAECALELSNGEGQARTQLLGLQPGFVQVSGNQSAIDARINWSFIGGGGVHGSVGVRDEAADFAKARLQGKLKLAIPGLDFLATLSPELSAVRGGLAAEFALQGRLDEPAPTGSLRLNDVAFDLATPNVSVRSLSLSVSADSSSKLSYNGAAQSDNGNIVVAGSTLLNGEQSKTTLSVKGSEFQIWNTADARVWVSPDLQLHSQDETAKLTGKVLVPRAQITPKQLPQSAVEVSRDQIVIRPSQDKRNQASARRSQPIDAHLSVQLGEQVEISAFGFNSRVGGELDLRQRPQKPLVASGELNVIDGEYRALGQGLVIDHGQFLFAGGEVDNPGLNVKASRRPAKDIVVGVNVRGELQQPDIKLFSEPSMSSSNQLSWLVLGRAMESASGAESDYISQAALALGVKGGNFLTKGLGERLGVDSIGIETGTGEAGAASDVNQAALVIGKYLTPQLYVSYGVSLLESTSTVKLRYLMTKRWSLVTESSVDTSAGDLSYTFEK